MSGQSPSLPISTPVSVLTAGAFQKNRACLIHNTQAHWSSLHGNLDLPEACPALAHSVDSLCVQAKGAPAALAHDMHADFYSSRIANTVAARLGVPIIPVQLYHAHIASMIAE